MKIINKITAIFVLLLLTNISCMAELSGASLVQKGDSFYEKVIQNENPELNESYLNKALYYYYVASKKENPPVDAFIGLGRIYTQKKKFSDAKLAFSKAYSLDSTNPKTNFYFAQYQYASDNYDLALKFFDNALKYGYKDREKNIEMLAKCYEKLGDLDSALKMYEQIGTEESSTKINELKDAEKEELNKEEIKEKIKEEVKEELKEEIKEELKEEIREEVKKESKLDLLRKKMKIKNKK